MLLRIALALLVALSGLGAQVSADGQTARENTVAAAIRLARIPPLPVGFSIGDGPAWNAIWGFASLENSVPALPETVIGLGSTAKPLTCVAAMQLVEEDDLAIVSHRGGQQGIRSQLLLVPERRITMAVLTNLEESGAPEIAKQMHDELMRARP